MGEMPAVEFPPTEEYFDQRREAENINPQTEVIETDFVDSSGWTTQMQTLLQAEAFYKDDCTVSSSASGCDDYDYWDDDADMDNPEEYQDTDDTNRDAWEIKLPGERDDDVFSDDGDPVEVFPGGFAGGCETGLAWQWRPGEDRWMCDGDISWDQVVLLPRLTGGQTIGMAVMPYNAYEGGETLDFLQGTGLESYSHAYEEAEHVSGSTDSLNEIHIECWLGDLDSGDTVPDDKKITGSVSVTDQEPFGIYGEVDRDDESTYSCSWSYDTDQYTGLDDLGADGVMPMHQLPSQDIDLFVDEYDGIPVDLRYTEDGFRDVMSGWTTHQDGD